MVHRVRIVRCLCVPTWLTKQMTLFTVLRPLHDSNLITFAAVLMQLCVSMHNMFRQYFPVFSVLNNLLNTFLRHYLTLPLLSLVIGGFLRITIGQ